MIASKVHSSRHDGMCTMLLRGTLVVLAFYGFIDILYRTILQTSPLLLGESSQDARPCWCGSTNSEAIDMGCIYDHIAVDWLPPYCHDADLVAEFDASGPNGTWPYYRNITSTTSGDEFALLKPSSTIDTLAREGEDYFATVGWHVAHCLFTWRKQLRFQQNGKGRLVVEPWNAKESHAQHCSEYIWNVLRSGRSLEEIGTFIPGKSRHVKE